MMAALLDEGMALTAGTMIVGPTGAWFVWVAPAYAWKLGTEAQCAAVGVARGKCAVISGWGVALAAFTAVLLVMCMVSLVAAMLTEPGILEEAESDDEADAEASSSGGAGQDVAIDVGEDTALAAAPPRPTEIYGIELDDVVADNACRERGPNDAAPAVPAPAPRPPAAPPPRRRRRPRVVVGGQPRELSDMRAKMCRQTENYVEHFDHFCPWVGNAVGRRNYPYFFAFLTFVCGQSLAVGLSSAYVLWRHLRGTRGALEIAAAAAERVPATALTVYSVFIFCTVSNLWSYHAYLIAVNQTTNEMIKGTYDDVPNPHDKGTRQNVLNFLASPVPPSMLVGGVYQAVLPLDEEDDGSGAVL